MTRLYRKYSKLILGHLKLMLSIKQLFVTGVFYVALLVVILWDCVT